MKQQNRNEYLQALASTLDSPDGYLVLQHILAMLGYATPYGGGDFETGRRNIALMLMQEIYEARPKTAATMQEYFFMD